MLRIGKLARASSLAMLAVTLVLASLPARAQTESSPMTNDDVIRMAELRVSDDAIIASIRAARTQFDVSNQTLSGLHAKGISSAVLAAMSEAVIRGLGQAPQGAAVTVVPQPMNQPAIASMASMSFEAQKRVAELAANFQVNDQA